MSQPCATTACKQTSRVLCHCCNQNLCLDHLSSHTDVTNFQSKSLTDQISILNEQLKRLDIDKLVDDERQKLDKWRDDSLKKVYRFYEKKCEELALYYVQKVRQLQYEINQVHKNLVNRKQKQDTINEDNTNELQRIIRETKQKIFEIEQKTIPINIRSLPINNNLIIIGETKTEEFDLTTLLSPYQTFDCPGKLGSAVASNDRFLLVDQNSILTLFDTDLTMIQQSLWNYSTIYDICWSSALSSFILITEKSKAYLVDENNLSIDCIEAMHNQLWVSCTCSNSLLYLASFSNAIVEFSLLPSICLTRRWDPPMTCNKNESIKDIACNDDTLAIIIAPFFESNDIFNSSSISNI